MHLLFTDPSTSPRTELGRVIFGVLYGLSIVALYELLGREGMPTFYDKLLPVPVLNLSIKLIDRVARLNVLRAFDLGARGRWLAPRQRHLAYLSVWGIVFAGMSAVQGVGDHHPGQWLPFWQTACMDGRRYACPYLAGCRRAFAIADPAGRAASSASFRPGTSSIAPGPCNRWHGDASSGLSPRVSTPARVTTAGDVGERPASRGRLPDRLAGQQGTDQRPHTSCAVHSRVPRGLA